MTNLTRAQIRAIWRGVPRAVVGVYLFVISVLAAFHIVRPLKPITVCVLAAIVMCDWVTDLFRAIRRERERSPSNPRLRE